MNGKNKKKILFVVLGNKEEIASSRLRAYELISYIEKKNLFQDIKIDVISKRVVVKYDYLSLIKFLLYNFIFLIKFSKIFWVKYDVIYCWQMFFSKRLAKYLSKKSSLILDITDLGVFVDEYINKRFDTKSFYDKISKVKILREKKAMLATCESANLITANAGLTLPEYIKPFDSKIRTLLDPVDLTNHSLTCDSEKIVVGWTGSPGTARFINSISNVLCQIHNEFKNKIEIRLHGTSPEMFTPEIRKIASIIEWTLENDFDEVNKIHIGLVPAIDDALGNYKQPYKVIRHLACGAPVIATPVGMVPFMVKNRETGFLAETEEDWLKYLHLLIENDNIRNQMGRNARKYAEENFSYKKYTEKWHEIICEVTK